MNIGRLCQKNTRFACLASFTTNRTGYIIHLISGEINFLKVPRKTWRNQFFLHFRTVAKIRHFGQNSLFISTCGDTLLMFLKIFTLNFKVFEAAVAPPVHDFSMCTNMFGEVAGLFTLKATVSTLVLPLVRVEGHVSLQVTTQRKLSTTDLQRGELVKCLKVSYAYFLWRLLAVFASSLKKNFEEESPFSFLIFQPWRV